MIVKNTRRMRETVHGVDHPKSAIADAIDKTMHDTMAEFNRHVYGSYVLYGNTPKHEAEVVEDETQPVGTLTVTKVDKDAGVITMDGGPEPKYPMGRSIYNDMRQELSETAERASEALGIHEMKAGPISYKDKHQLVEFAKRTCSHEVTWRRAEHVVMGIIEDAPMASKTRLVERIKSALSILRTYERVPR